ncbi:MAG TPA: NERD domain-containing protein [Candidatus Cloacimonas acidaminovorans]|jgi:hypothetical protein|nr:NERD domain-containing protein [Candidatus Cloacimonas acidaminovorans]HNZ88169.1 NERD domain-containing protein [Candidatus Cloacimonas acidaminovorans]HOI01276.1 NERD domain-containing protein [Candidatus Cloacimonas acidaminovorans]HPU99390.1 NERD domain-containing protein [Candidatus Cloacimonas acidaminovorans]
MLEIYKGHEVQRSYENVFFRDFSTRLGELFEKRGFKGILLGYPVCTYDNGLQIDALLITERVICIIDFKNYGGTIQLPDAENFSTERWVKLDHSPITVQGGSYINPFVQLREQKKKFTKILSNVITKELPPGEKLIPEHIVSIVCFHEPVTITGNIPKKHEMVFFIVDSNNYLEKLDDIIDVKDGGNLVGTAGFELFKKYFRIDESYEVQKPYEESSSEAYLKTLRVDQRTALDAMEKFLGNPEKKVFILSGTTNSGKTYLIPFLNRMATIGGIDAVVNMVPNAKIASNTIIPGVEEVENIYNYIFNFREVNIQKDQEEEHELFGTKEVEDDETYTEIIPLGRSEDAYNALYIVDEAQMITDNRIANELMIFGSGYLLSDFLDFCDLDKTDRKVIFLGDPYQVSYGRSDRSAICWEFMKLKFGNRIEQAILNDNPTFSEITTNALVCVEALRNEKYNNLNFPQSRRFRKMNKESVLAELNETKGFPPGTMILTYSNEQAYDWNLRIKEIVIPGTQEPTEGDIIVFFNTARGVSPSDKSLYRYIQNKQFAMIRKTDCSKTREFQVEFKKHNFKIVIKEITINLFGCSEDLTVRYLDSYFQRTSGFKDIEEMKAIQKLKMVELSKFRTANPFISSPELIELGFDDEYNRLSVKYPEISARILKSNRKIKTSSGEEQQLVDMVKNARSQYLERTKSLLENDMDSTYSILANLALIKYGWALTVHKAIPEKWQQVYVIANRRQGKNNRAYFSWVYSGISRGTDKVTLVDFQAINPYLNASISGPEQGTRLLDLFMSVPEENLNYVPELLLQRLRSVFADMGITIEHIKSSQYQERFRFILDDNFVDASFNYNGNGLISYPKYTKFKGEEFKQMINALIHAPNSLGEKELAISDWRKEEYTSLIQEMTREGIKLTAIISNNWKDTLVLTGTAGRLVVEFHYDKRNTFTSIKAISCSDEEIWTKLKEYIKGDPEDVSGHENSI